VFFDLNENSMMDVLLVKGSSPTSVQAIFNNFDKDAFFLKTRVVSDSYLGINVPQASFRCILTSLEDEKFMASAGQSSQTAYQ
jgi:hypothetical protein